MTGLLVWGRERPGRRGSPPMINHNNRWGWYVLTCFSTYCFFTSILVFLPLLHPFQKVGLCARVFALALFFIYSYASVHVCACVTHYFLRVSGLLQAPSGSNCCYVPPPAPLFHQVVHWTASSVHGTTGRTMGIVLTDWPACWLTNARTGMYEFIPFQYPISWMGER